METIERKDYYELKALIDRQLLPSTDHFDDSYCYIYRVSVELDERNGSDYPYSSVKKAIQRINDEREYIFLDRPRSEYDCTGAPFTTSLERINRFVAHGYLHAIFVHHIAIDC